jgi:hypothetical protein
MDTLEPQDELTEDTINFLRNLGSSARFVSDIVNTRDPVVYREIQTGT